MMWGRVLLGRNGATCLFSIPLFATVPFIMLIWLLRKGAPTDLARTAAVLPRLQSACRMMAITQVLFHTEHLPFAAVLPSAHMLPQSSRPEERRE